MNKYVAIFYVPSDSMKDWVASVDEATRKEQTEKLMQDWGAWQEANKDSIVDGGLPLGKTKRVTKDAVIDVRNDLNYYMVIQAESHEAAATIMQNNPHVQVIPSSYVEIMDANHMGGM